MTTQDTNIRCAVRRTARLGALAALILAVSATAGSSESAAPSGLTNGSGAAVAQSPLIPRKTRHILKFSRWGIA